MENTNNTVQTKKNNKWLYWFVIIILLILNVVQSFMSRNHKQDINLLTYKVQETNEAKALLEEEYKLSLTRLDDLIGKNANLDNQLNQKDSELARTKARIQEILTKHNANAEELTEAKDLIIKLNTRIINYEKEIISLNKENFNLKLQKDSILDNNEDLIKKVEIAKVLNASNIRLVPIKQNKKGTKENLTAKASKVDLLRLTFDIDRNYLAEGGSNDLYIRLIAPNGELLMNETFGSGSFVLNEGSKMQYSISKTVRLEPGKPINDISVDWLQDDPYLKGFYNVEIFHRGYVIGIGDVFLK